MSSSSPLFKDPILVTGAAGFIGGRFVESCNRRGQAVISCDLLTAFSDRPEFSRLQFGKTLAIDDLLSWLKTEKPKLGAIVHMGACSSTTETNWDYLQKNNIEYSQELFRFATQAKIPFVYASSAATYGAGEQGYNDDESKMHSLVPLNLYGKSKLLFDLWVLEQEKSGNTPPAWSGFKFFNVYGFGEAHKGGMASVAFHAYHQILKTGQVRLFKSHHPDYRDGEQKRDFVCVEDVCEVLWFSLSKPDGQAIRRGIFNLGTGHAQTFLDLVNPVFKALKKTPKIEFVDTPLHIRNQYQYFTQAQMQKLRIEGYTPEFRRVDAGVALYMDRLLKS